MHLFCFIIVFTPLSRVLLFAVYINYVTSLSCFEPVYNRTRALYPY